MTPVIVTLPLAPKKNARLGSFLTPFAAWLVGRMTGHLTIVGINCLGAKGYAPTDAARFQHELSALLGSMPACRVDSRQDWRGILGAVTERGRAEGWISAGVRTVEICPCGKTEFLQGVDSLLTNGIRRKTCSVVDGRAVCRLCDGYTGTVSKKVLLMRLPAQTSPATWLPAYAEKEVRQLEKDSLGRELLISRSRSTGVNITLSEGLFEIDIDFCNALMPYVLSREGCSTMTLVVGNRTLHQGRMAVAVSQLLGQRINEILVLPFFLLQMTTGEEPSTAVLIEQADPRVLRVLLAMAVGGKSKDCILPSRLIHLIATSLRIGESRITVAGQHESTPSKDFHGLWSKDRIEAELASLRRTVAGNRMSTTPLLSLVCQA